MNHREAAGVIRCLPAGVGNPGAGYTGAHQICASLTRRGAGAIPDSEGHVHPADDHTGGSHRARGYCHHRYCDRYKRKTALIAAGVANFRAAADRLESGARDNRDDSDALHFPRLYLLCRD